MPTGTSIVVSTRPATTSSRSQAGSYVRNVYMPGSHREAGLIRGSRCGEAAGFERRWSWRGRGHGAKPALSGSADFRSSSASAVDMNRRMMPQAPPVLPVEAVTDGGSGFHHPYTDPLRAKFIRHSRQFMRALQIDVGRRRQVDHHEARQGDLCVDAIEDGRAHVVDVEIDEAGFGAIRCPGDFLVVAVAFQIRALGSGIRPRTAT